MPLLKSEGYMTQASLDSIKDLKVLVLKENENFVAQCLDYNITVQAPVEDGMGVLKSRFAYMIASFVIAAKENKTGDPFKHLKKAPERFWKMWELMERSTKKNIIHVDLTNEEAFLSSQEIEAEATFLVTA